MESLRRYLVQPALRFWRLLTWLITYLLGRPRLSWNPPAWIVRAKEVYIQRYQPKARARREQFLKWSAAHRKELKVSGIALAVLAAAGTGGYIWWDLQPKPKLVKVSLIQPRPTPLEEKAEPYPLVVAFDSSAAPLEAVGKSVDDGIELSPRFDGTWQWESDTRLVFTPKSDWPVDEKFHVNLSKSYFPKHLRLNRETLDFKSPSFSIVSSESEYYQHPDIPKDKRVTVNIQVSHPVDPGSLKDKVSVELEGNTEVLGKIPRRYGANITYDKYFGQIHIVSDTMPLPLKDTVAKIVVEKGLKSSRGGNKIEKNQTFEVKIPGMFSYFQVQEASFSFAENREYALEQVISVLASTEVLEGEFDKAFEAYLLPPEYTKSDGGVDKRHIWRAGEVTPQILSESTRIDLKRVPGERPQAKLHTFKLADVPAGRDIFVRLKKGLFSFHEYILAENFETVLRVRPYPKEIRILHEGSLLALSGDRKLSILTRGIQSFQIEAAHVLPDQLNHLISQTSGRFTDPAFMNNYYFNWENITEKFTEINDVAKSDSGKPEFAAFDAGKFLNKGQGGARGLLYIRLRPYDRQKKEASGQSETRFLLVTDLGIVHKQMADKSHDVFVQSIKSGQPVAGASVQVVGKNGLKVLESRTDSQGRAHFPDLSDFKLEKQPLAFVITYGQDLSFLPFDRDDRRLQYSRFDVGGIHTQGEEDRLQAFVFSDRGLYRPGEAFHLSSIIRSLDWRTALNGVPLEWVLSDPKGQEFYKEKATLDGNGFIELNSQTTESSFTGTYTASLYLVDRGERRGLLGSTTFRVEEFVPDRTKIAAGFSVSEAPGWVSPAGLKAWVRVHNLFGFPAENRRVTASYTLWPAAPVFGPYKDYRFFFPKTDKNYREQLSDSQSNEKGEVEYAMDFSRFEKGSYTLRLEAEAFEAEGGRSVVAQASVMVSPYKYFVGHKSDSDLSYLKLGFKAIVDFIAVDSGLKKSAVQDLKIRLVEKQWISVLTKQSNGTFKYESVRRDKEISKTDFRIAATGTSFPLPTGTPGDFKLIVENNEGAEVALLEFSVVGETNVLGRVERNAELQIKLSKTDYAPGEDIEMQIRAPYVGSGMITIERDKVYAVKWFKTSTNNSIQSIKVPAKLEGNAYVNVTFLRDISSREIFMSPLSYGVVPFSVDLKRRQLKLDLKVASEHRPGSPMKIEFSGTKPGKIIVFAVDEGILQVAKYQTPDPLKVFFRKRALEIETSQLLDLVLPEYRIVKELSASGGDADNMVARNLNPFRRKGKPPAAYWSGILNLDTKRNSVTYNLPDYFNGTMRVMAVAVTPDAIGVLRTDTLVRGDFIITPTVPLVLTPGDEAVIGVSVFNNARGSGSDAKVRLDVQASDHLEVIEGGAAEMSIPETKETSTTLRVRAKDMLGVASLQFRATLDGKSTNLGEEISLRPASPYRTQVWAGTVDKGTRTIDVARKAYPEFARRSVMVSFLPLSLAHGLSQFLSDFPYGCTEQLLSKAIPTLVLGDKVEFAFKPEQRETAFRKAIQTLRQRQTPDGGFGLYSSYGTAAIFPSLYSINYLIEARERGFAVPLDMQERVKGYLNSFASLTANDLSKARNTAFALYLLARFGENVGNQLNTLEKEIDASSLRKSWPSDLGALFTASTYKLMKQDELAGKIAKGVVARGEFFAEVDAYHDQYIHNAYVMYLLARHFPERLKAVSETAVESFVTMIQNHRYNTLNSALAILALETFSKAGGQAVEIVASVNEVDAQGKKTPLVLPKTLFPSASFSPAAKTLEVASEASHKVYYQAHQSAYERKEGLKAISEKLEIQREYRAVGGSVPVLSAKVGDELEVHLKLRSLDGNTYANVAVVDLLPSGFEVVLERSAHTALCEPLKAKEARTASIWNLFIPRVHAQEEEMEPSTEEDDSSEEEREDTELRATREAPRAEAAEMPTLAQSGSTLRVDFEEPREDRMVLYATVTGSMSEYVYKIKATNRGQFTVPPAFAEHMYDRSAQAMGQISTIKVEAAK